jgi:hypothetical protein
MRVFEELRSLGYQGSRHESALGVRFGADVGQRRLEILHRGVDNRPVVPGPPADFKLPVPLTRGGGTVLQDKRLTVRDTLGIPPTETMRHRRSGRGYPSP